MAVERAVLAVLHDDLRRLRDTREQLVRRVRREHQRAGARTARADRVHVLIERVELGVRQPRFVEMQRVEQIAEQVLDHLDVVDHAVVRALRDRQDARLQVRILRQRLARERIRLDLLANVFRLELVARNRADDAEVIARRREEHGDRAGHRDRVQDRLVAVAVDQHDVARRHRRVPDDLVRRRRAVGHEEQMVRAEDARRVALGGRDRPGVVEQLAEFVDGIADVRAQHVLAEELVEHLAERVLQERDAARVPRAVPRVRAFLRVLHEFLEERRRERIEIDLRLADDVARDELRRVLEHVDEAVQFAQDVVRQVARGARLAVQEDRDVGVAAAHRRDERAQRDDRRREFRRIAVRDHDVLGIRQQFVVVDRQDEARRAARLLRERSQVAVARQAEHFGAFALDRLGERADAGTRDVLGAKVFVDDDDGKTELHGANLQMERPLAGRSMPGSSGLSATGRGWRCFTAASLPCARQVFGSVTPRCP